MELTAMQIYEMRAEMREYTLMRFRYDVSDKKITSKVIKAYNPEGENGVWIYTGEESHTICCVDLNGDKYIITVQGVRSLFDAEIAIINHFCGCVCFFDKYGNTFKF